jgi:hypothetical protein
VPADDHRVVWFWVVGGLLVWLVLALLVSVAVGRGIRLADQRAAAAALPLSAADVPGVAPAASPRAVALRTRRRTVPLPPVGVALAALAVTLMTTGFVVRLTGVQGEPARLLSMDAPFSVPRLFVALLFAAAAVAAVAGAGALPGRRAWWLAVGLVAAGIAAVKAGGSVHTDAQTALADAVGETAVLVLGVAAVAAVLGVLWFLSRSERRDRRRVLGALALYAVAAVGLSAVSGAVPSGLSVTATFLEESGEALAGVAFLMAVLVGVAPQLVLPADWALRRSLDAETVVVSDTLTGRLGGPGTIRS